MKINAYMIRLSMYRFWLINSLILNVYLINCQLITNRQSLINNDLIDCNRTKIEYKYEFTDCDESGGKWRIMVPAKPFDQCSSMIPLTYVPKRIDKCYISCGDGQYFNKSTLSCEQCPKGYYSLQNGLIISDFNRLNSQRLPEGFYIKNINHFDSSQVTGDDPEQFPGWHVDNRTGMLQFSIDSNQALNVMNNHGYISLLNYRVKFIRKGRLKFRYLYRYQQQQQPQQQYSIDFTGGGNDWNNWPITLLFQFNYHRLSSIDGHTTAEDGFLFGVDNDLNIKYPPMTTNNHFKWIEIPVNDVGLYVFQWKCIVIHNLNGYFEGSSPDQFGFEPSIALIRIEKIIVEGIETVSECTECDPGQYAPTEGMRECLSCPPNTASNQSGRSECHKCDPLTEYSNSNSKQCSKRPVCGRNDLYLVKKCQNNRQLSEYQWIEPRICVDSDQILEKLQSKLGESTTIEHCNDTIDINDCDAGMESSDNGTCKFCPNGHYRNEQMASKCEPCKPMTNPYYKLHIKRWNKSLSGWSASIDSIQNQTSFEDNPEYLNYYFARQCYNDYDDDYDSYHYGNSDDFQCNSWQTFDDHIRTIGTSKLALQSYLILSLNVPQFGMNNDDSNELIFEFEIDCDRNDQCLLMFVESFTLIDDNYNGRNSMNRMHSIRYHQQQPVNRIIKQWTISGATTNSNEDDRTIYRYKILKNLDLPRTFSWIFKRQSSYQSYVRINSIIVIGSSIGSIIECRGCKFTNNSTNQCIRCPRGQYLDEISQSNESMKQYECRRCPENFVLKSADYNQIGNQSCVKCEENLKTINADNECLSNCLVNFADAKHYNLSELPRPLLYRGVNLFTSAGTQYLNLINLTLCGHSKLRNNGLSTCTNNLTLFADDNFESTESPPTIRSYICRSTLIPDGPKIFSAQAVSLGDELLTITRRTTFENISIHREFVNDSMANRYDQDYYLYFRTRSSSSTMTSSTTCSNGKTLTITMRCVLSDRGGKVLNIRTPKSCPDGTCNGCDYHFLIETSTAAACHYCRLPPNITSEDDHDQNQSNSTTEMDDFQIIIGECSSNGQQNVHYIRNPLSNCVLPTDSSRLSSLIRVRKCSFSLPRNMQAIIALVIIFGLLLLSLVGYFWNKNRSLEYKYTKLIENTKGSKGSTMIKNRKYFKDKLSRRRRKQSNQINGNDHFNGPSIQEDDDIDDDYDDDIVTIDNCCVIEDDDDDDLDGHLSADHGDQSLDANNNNRKTTQRVKLKQLFNNGGSSSSRQSNHSTTTPATIIDDNNANDDDNDDGYETIQLISSSTSSADPVKNV